MIRVIYTFKVKEGQEEQFIKAWTRATHAIKASVKGALGSMLLKSRTNRLEYRAIAKWNSYEEWQSFRSNGISADPQARQQMLNSSEIISIDYGDQIEDIH